MPRMSVQSWENYFKPEVRSSGQAFVRQNKVTVSQLSDTEIQGYVRASSSFKVLFKSPSVESHVITADCSCPLSKKGQFCKHIWAALLVIEDKKPDFLDSKTEIEKKAYAPAETTAQSKPVSTVHSDSQAAYKQKQNDYRKEMYQKQKARLKAQKKKDKGIVEDNSYPEPVEEALKYFVVNGFELRDTFTKEAVGMAKKELSRVFHPDVGGSHDEILELNKHAEVLSKFSKF